MGKEPDLSGRKARVEKAESALKESSGILHGVILGQGRAEHLGSFAREIWQAFAKVEYAVLLIKLHLREENPGRLMRLPELSENLSDEIVKAGDLVSHAIQDIERESYNESLQHAREARDILREIQIVLRKARESG